MNEEAIATRVDEILAGRYEITEVTKVPSAHELSDANRGLTFPAVVLAADIRDSSWMLEDHQKQTVAKLHRAFLYVAAECVRSCGGHLRSFDGDGLLAFWYDSDDEAAQYAVGAALRILKLWKSQLANRIAQYRDVDFGAAVTRGRILAVKAGLDGAKSNSSPIWIDDAVNLAVKMAKQARSPRPIVVTKDVWAALTETDRYRDPNALFFKEPRWSEATFTYRSAEVPVYAFRLEAEVIIEIW